MLDVIQGILGLGAAVMLPIVISLLGIIFRMPIGKALKAGLMVGIGFTGLQLVINFLMATVEPAINYYSGLDSTDSPPSMSAGRPWVPPRGRCHLLRLRY